MKPLLPLIITSATLLFSNNVGAFEFLNNFFSSDEPKVEATKQSCIVKKMPEMGFYYSNDAS